VTKAGVGVIALFLLAATAGAEELYRWVDEEGRVHFGDRPPTEAKAEDIGGELRPINTADGTAAPEKVASRQSVDPQREYQDKQRQRQLREQQQMSRACGEARRQLRILQGPVAVIDENGKEIKMTERERQRQAERLQREVDRICG